MEMCILVSSGCYYKIPHTEWLKHVNLFSHNSRDLKVQEQGGGRSQFPVRTLFLAWRQPPSHYVFTWPFLGAHTKREWVRSLSSLIGTLILSSQGHIVMLSFDLDYFHKSKYSYTGCQLQHMNYEETPTLSH